MYLHKWIRFLYGPYSASKEWVLTPYFVHHKGKLSKTVQNTFTPHERKSLVHEGRVKYPLHTSGCIYTVQLVLLGKHIWIGGMRNSVAPSPELVLSCHAHMFHISAFQPYMGIKKRAFLLTEDLPHHAVSTSFIHCSLVQLVSQHILHKVISLSTTDVTVI